MGTQRIVLNRETLAKVKFGPALHRDGTKASELISVIIQNYLTKEVLYGASMSQKTLAETIEKRLVVLYSQSRKCRWLKGETSGDMLKVIKIFLNCDNNQLLIQVIPLGMGVCHEKDENGKSKPTCFGKLLLEVNLEKENVMRKEMVLGIPSGSLLEPTVALLKKLGIEVIINGRNFVAEIRGSGIFFKAIIMRPNDLPLAVKMGVVDAAITGLDMCFENGLESEVFTVAKLNFSKKSRIPAKVVVFCRQDDFDEIVDSEEVAVSSEYVNLASTVFKKSKIVFSSGSTEIKVAIKAFGFRYGIGVVESGKSLEDNGLKIIKTIVTSPAVLIAREETEELGTLGQMLSGALAAELYQLVKFNADSDAQEEIVKILPSLESPTISALADGAIAIETVVPKNILTDTIIAIKKAGGRNILIQEINVTV